MAKLPKHTTDPPTFAEGPTPGTVRDAQGIVHTPPQHWTLLPPGDAALTRRVKATGDFWIVQEKKGRRTFSRGIWAPIEVIDRIQAELETERSSPSYAKRREADKNRRDRAQESYVDEFFESVVNYLDFHPQHSALANRMARSITEHATPVGSGTVARTKRIPVEKRAEAATIAWMRHQTTAYDTMKIERVKGKRREVRRMLAQQTKQLLQRYRAGEPAKPNCPLKLALEPKA